MSGDTGFTIADFGLPSAATSQIPAEHANRVAAVLDCPRPVPDGSALPFLWHWAFFTPESATADLGRDGHPRMLPGTPTQGLPRRMWAGGRVSLHTDLLVGTPATRHSHLQRFQRKMGRRGPLVVVTVAHKIRQAGRLVVSEEQDLVYLPPRDTAETMALPSGDHHPAAPKGGWVERRVFDAMTLFRFSAATFNSHRIHYDRDYAMAEEGYPRPVVHGPLTAILLAESASRTLGRGLRTIEFRAVNPLFEGLPVTIAGVADNERIEMTAVRNDRAVAMTSILT